jgi:hypothetical protein
MLRFTSDSTTNDRTAKEAPPEGIEHSTICNSSTCSTGACSPCIVIWSMVGFILLVNMLLNMFD